MLLHGLPAATQARIGAPSAIPVGNSAIIDAAVTQRPRTCMHTLTPLKSSPTRAGGATTRRGAEQGAPQGPEPWSRRWAPWRRA